MIGENSNDWPTPIACAQSTPLVPCACAASSWLVRPTPIIDPTSVCELEKAGRNTRCPGSRRSPRRAARTHREAGRGVDLQDQFDRQQRDDAESDRTAGHENPEKVEQARPDDGEIWRQRVGVDHRRNRIGGVVKSVDELEAERDQQGTPEQDVGQNGMQRCEEQVVLTHGRDEEETGTEEYGE